MVKREDHKVQVRKIRARKVVKDGIRKSFGQLDLPFPTPAAKNNRIAIGYSTNTSWW